MAGVLPIIRKVIKHKGVIKYSINTAWMVGDRIINMVLGLTMGILVARYLGPEKFGILNYVLAFAGLLSPFNKLGLDGVIARDIAHNKSETETILANSFILKFIGSLLTGAFLVSFMLITKRNSVYIYLGLIISLSYVFQSFEVIELYYRAIVKTKVVFLSKLLGNIISSLLKLGFIYLSFELVYFGIAWSSFMIFTMLFLLYFFRKEKVILSSKNIDLRKGIDLIKESWPLIFSGVFAIIYLNIDQIMIENMIGSYYLGQYSVAVRLTSVWNFIPITIAWSIQTAIVAARKKSMVAYYERLQLFSTVVVVLAYGLILPITYFSKEIVGFLYGAEYNVAGGVLAVHIFSSLFIFVGQVRGLWALNESYFKYILLANVGAGLLNIILNFLWLPNFGIMGAAWATLISYFLAYVGVGLFFKPAYKLFFIQMRSILLIDVFNQVKRLKKH